MLDVIKVRTFTEYTQIVSSSEVSRDPVEFWLFIFLLFFLGAFREERGPPRRENGKWMRQSDGPRISRRSTSLSSELRRRRR